MFNTVSEITSLAQQRKGCSMDEMNVEMCPETGICSLVKSGTDKADLMPFEVEDLKAAAGDTEKARQIIANASSEFAKNLSEEELKRIIAKIK